MPPTSDASHDPEAELDGAVATFDDALDAADAGDVATAERLGLEALAAFERVDGPDSPDVANVCNHLARMAIERGDLVQGGEHAARARDISEPHVDASPELAMIHLQARQSLARIAMMRGRYDDARVQLQEALHMAERVLPSDHVELASILNAL